MPFRFRKRTRLFPGVSLNWSKNGLSSVSIGGAPFTMNIPVAREGGVRQTASLVGTGLSWTEQAPTRSTRERRQAQRPAPQQTSTEGVIQDLMAALVGVDCVGAALWGMHLNKRVLDYPDTPRNVREAAVLIRNPEACELHCRRARGQAATIRAAKEIITAVQTVLAWTEAQGWSEPA